jgi:hypothetical protein
MFGFIDLNLDLLKENVAKIANNYKVMTYEEFDEILGWIRIKEDIINSSCILINKYRDEFSKLFKPLYNRILELKNNNLVIKSDFWSDDNNIVKIDYKNDIELIKIIINELKINMMNMNLPILNEYLCWLKKVDTELKFIVYDIYNHEKISSFLENMHNVARSKARYEANRKKDIEKNTQKNSINDMHFYIDYSTQNDLLKKAIDDNLTFLEYKPNCDDKKPNLIGVATIIGSSKSKKQTDSKTGTKYKISISKLEEDNNVFTCSCPNYKTICYQEKLLCKHICFLICKIGNILKPYIFNKKQILPDDLDLLINNIKSYENSKD